MLRKFQICWKKPVVAPLAFEDALCSGEAKVCVQTRSTLCWPSASRASTAMMTRLATSKATSQMGARCRISFCVRTEATSVNLKSHRLSQIIVDLLHSACHRVFPLHALEQIEVGKHFASTQHHRGKRIVGQRNRQSGFD